MRAHYRGEPVVLTLALGAIGWVFVPWHVPVLSVLLALPLLFLLPGYALMSLMFQTQPLDVMYRLLVSVGISLVIDILVGMLLHLFAFGLHSSSWSFALGGLTLVFTLWSWALQKKRSWSGSFRQAKA